LPWISQLMVDGARPKRMDCKNVPPNSFVGGNPAQVIPSIDD